MTEQEIDEIFAALKAYAGPAEPEVEKPAKKAEPVMPAWVRYRRRPVFWNGKLWH